MGFALARTIAVVAMAIGGWSVLARGADAGETAELQGLQLVLPAGFRRADVGREVELKADMLRQFSRASPEGLENARTRLYVREGDGVAEELHVIAVPQGTLPVADPEFVESTRTNYEGLARANGGTLRAFGPGTTSSGVPYLAFRIELPETEDGARVVRYAALPRQDRLFLVILWTVGRGGADATEWEAVLASLHTNQAPPVTAGSVWGVARIIQITAFALILLAVARLAVLSARRRRAAAD
jgi:hypothetical protein